MKKIIFHIGFPKTGTSYLQSQVFPKLDLSYYNLDKSRALFQQINFEDDLEYDIVEVSKSFSPLINNKVSLFSNEGIINPLFIYGGINKSIIASRLKQLAEYLNVVPKVIISIRKQDEVIKSLYCQYLNQGGTASFEKFFLSHKSNAGLTLFNPNYLNYYGLIRKYIELFGKENILILIQEEFRSNEIKLYDDLTKFCEVERKIDIEALNPIANQSLSKFSYLILRLTNYFTSSFFMPKGFLPFFKNGHVKRFLKWLDKTFRLRKYSPVPSKSMKRDYDLVISSYRNTNKDLERLLGIDLKKHNYLE